jgi:hypothetical protein
MNTKTTVKYQTVRDSDNNIISYIAINNGYIFGQIYKVDAIGLGVVFTFNGFVFDTLKAAKQFAQAGA